MNRKVYYGSLRSHENINLTVENVAGMEFLLDQMEREQIPLRGRLHD